MYILVYTGRSEGVAPHRHHPGVRKTRDALKRLSEAKGMTGAELLAALVQRAQEDAELDAMNEGFRKLRADPQAWAEYQAELALWDNTLAYGLEDLDDEWR